MSFLLLFPTYAFVIAIFYTVSPSPLTLSPSPITLSRSPLTLSPAPLTLSPSPLSTAYYHHHTSCHHQHSPYALSPSPLTLSLSPLSTPYHHHHTSYHHHHSLSPITITTHLIAITITILYTYQPCIHVCYCIVGCVLTEALQVQHKASRHLERYVFWTIYIGRTRHHGEMYEGRYGDIVGMDIEMDVRVFVLRFFVEELRGNRKGYAYSLTYSLARPSTL